jgi:xenotropic and polytropic retrovirus receptor 1
MDWSLCQPNAKKWLLRDVRGYKNTYYYYLAMVVDVILRFNWIFYAIYTSDVQHSSLVSFLIALSEVTRRGMWTLFRVENEHCSNVCSFKASRNIPLPYHLSSATADTFERPPAVGKSSEEEEAPANVSLRTARAEAQATALNQGPPPSTPGRALMALFSKAHAQDFEKKKQGEGSSVHLHHMSHEEGVECSSDEYEEEDEG